MDTEYYLQQILGKLENIEDNTNYILNNTNSIDAQQGVIMVYNRDLYNAFHTESGDFLPSVYHDESINNSSVYLGCICLILMITLLISLFPHRKGVLKKHD